MDPLEILAARDARISDVFYFFEKLTTLASGRTVGRKIGVVQETMLRWYLEDEPELNRRMYLEQKLLGASGASHKVEFSWYAIDAQPSLQVGDELPGTFGLTIASADPDTGRVRLQGPWGGNGIWLPAQQPARVGALKTHLDDYELDLRVHAVAADGVSLDIVDRSRLLASLESKRVGAQRFSGSDKLGSGIQTIEKAKQASLVAIDVDIKHNGTVKPLQDGGEQKETISLVALGNGVHWTDKDKAVLGTYVDYTFLAKDAGIIRYAEFVRDLADQDEDFMDYFKAYFNGMTKQEPDDFEVADDDFEIIEPADEQRTLRQVLLDHVQAVNG
jgi:hypothetical protein